MEAYCVLTNGNFIKFNSSVIVCLSIFQEFEVSKYLYFDANDRYCLSHFSYKIFLAVGDEEGKVRLFNIRKQRATSDGRKAPLRIFKAHESAVHTVR